jgi:hypothetical protein
MILSLHLDVPAPEPTNLHGNVLELSKLQLSHALFTDHEAPG